MQVLTNNATLRTAFPPSAASRGGVTQDNLPREERLSGMEDRIPTSEQNCIAGRLDWRRQQKKDVKKTPRRNTKNFRSSTRDSKSGKGVPHIGV